MTILLEGMERIRDLVEADIDSGKAGTGTTLPTAADTGLETGVADTDLALTNKKIAKDSITVTHILTTAEGNGSTITEWEVRNSSDDSYNRIVKAGFAKTALREATMVHTFVFNRRIT